jgi:hypothetical protein
MNSPRWRFAPAAWAFIALITGLVCASPAHAQTTFSGRAFAAFVNTPFTGPIFLSDTGQLPARGMTRFSIPATSAWRR